MTDTYVSPTFQLYECTVCKKQFKIQVGCSITDTPNMRIMQHLLMEYLSVPKEERCCTVASVIEVKDEKSIQS